MSSSQEAGLVKKKGIGLVPRLLIAIVLGIIFGLYAPELFNRTIVTVSALFSSFLKFVIPLMILAFVTVGIADLSQGAGKLLCITAVIAYGSTLIAGSVAYIIAINFFPSFIMTLGIAMVASPGAPGGSSMSALPFLPLVGIASDGAIASLLIALYITQDSFGTACNVSGDNAISVVIEKIYQKFINKGGVAEKSL